MPHLTPKKYEKMSPIQTGCADTPIRTNTIAALSTSERGLSAEKIPTESPMIIQRTAPPNTSDAVTGAACLIVSSRLAPVAYCVPSVGCWKCGTTCHASS